MPVAFSNRSVADIKELVSVILPPATELASAATGFYFAGHK
jgi:hypothetical protein